MHFNDVMNVVHAVFELVSKLIPNFWKEILHIVCKKSNNMFEVLLDTFKCIGTKSMQNNISEWRAKIIWQTTTRICNFQWCWVFNLGTKIGHWRRRQDLSLNLIHYKREQKFRHAVVRVWVFLRPKLLPFPS